MRDSNNYLKLHGHCMVRRAHRDRIPNRINKVRVYDFTEYDPELCCNGGAYEYHITYTRIKKDVWQVSHGTSADFEYCPATGSFINGCPYRFKSCSKCRLYSTASTKEVEMDVFSHKGKRNYDIEFDIQKNV